MRGALAAAVLGLSLWIGSLAWSGFVLLGTVLDPDRSGEVAEALYDDEVVRAQLADGLAAAIRAALPPGAPVPAGAVEAAAEGALASAVVEAVFVDALTQTHSAFLGEGEPPDRIDTGGLGTAVRDGAVARQPALDAILPAEPQLAVDLPTERLPDLGPVRDLIAAAVPVLALVSLTGAIVALLVAADRPAVVRRAGASAVGLSTLVLVVGYGVPWVAARVLPDRAAVVDALIREISETTRGPALVLAGLGATAVLASTLWRHAPGGTPRPRAKGPWLGGRRPPGGPVGRGRGC